MPDQELTPEQYQRFEAAMRQSASVPGATVAMLQAQADQLKTQLLAETPAPPKSFAERTQDRLAKTFAQQDQQATNVERTTRDPALMASMGAAALTGGASLPIQALAQGGAGLASGAARAYLRGGSPGEMALSGVGDVVTNTLPMGVGAGLRAAAPALMESALRINAPIARKFGMERVGKVAVAERILPNAAGREKVDTLLGAAGAEKEALLQAANQRASVLPRGIVGEAFRDIRPAYQQQVKGGGGQANIDLATEFLAQHPQGISPSDLNQAKVYWDDLSNAARRSVHVGGRIGAEEKLPIALAKASGKTLEQVAPGVQALNSRIMGLQGVKQAVQGRVDIPARGLDKLAAAYGTAEALATGNPQVAAALLATKTARQATNMGRGAIGADIMGQGLTRPGAAPMAELIRQALLSFLTGPR